MLQAKYASAQDKLQLVASSFSGLDTLTGESAEQVISVLGDLNVTDASAVIYQFPFYWMSAPSLLKKWQDEVFTFLSKTPAVAGKPLTVVTTTGSEFDAYRSGGRNGFTMDELLRPYQGSAIHSGMVWQTPIVVYGMGTADAGKNIAEGANTYRQRVEMLVNSSNAGNNW